jgi:hypothetical protein
LENFKQSNLYAIMVLEGGMEHKSFEKITQNFPNLEKL